MKTIGKIAALAMTLSLAFVLTACGGSASSSAAASSSSASASTSSASASASASAASESASASAASASASADGEANAYTNDFFGIEFDLPEGWSFVDEQTISQTNQLVAAASESSEVDMVAMNAEQSQIVIVGTEPSNSKNAGMTAEAYLEAQEEALKASFGDTYAYTSESATITFEGIDRELPATIMNVNLNGGNLTICQTVAEKDGNFFSVTIMGASQEEVSSAMGYFSGSAQ